MKRCHIKQKQEHAGWLRERGYVRQEDGSYIAEDKPSFKLIGSLWHAQGSATEDSRFIETGRSPSEALENWKRSIRLAAEELQNAATALLKRAYLD